MKRLHADVYSLVPTWDSSRLPQAPAAEAVAVSATARSCGRRAPPEQGPARGRGEREDLRRRGAFAF